MPQPEQHGSVLDYLEAKYVMYSGGSLQKEGKKVETQVEELTEQVELEDEIVGRQAAAQ